MSRVAYLEGMKDVFLTKIGERPSGGRLWIEDSYKRLLRHGFAPGVGLLVHPRQSGVGFVIAPGGDRLTVSRRGEVPLLSLEGSMVDTRMSGETVRVRASFNNIAVLPRAFALNFRGLTEDAVIRGTSVAIGSRLLPLNTPSRQRLGGVGRLDFHTDATNGFWGCEMIAHHRPLHVVLLGTETQVVAQYLLSTGYQTQDQLNYTR